MIAIDCLSPSLPQVRVAEDPATGCVLISLHLPPPNQVRLKLHNTTPLHFVVRQVHAPAGARPLRLEPNAEVPWAWHDPSAEPALMVHPIIQLAKYGSVARLFALGTALGRSGKLTRASAQYGAQYGRYRMEGPGRSREGPGTEYKISSVEILASMFVGSPQREVCIDCS